MFWNIRKNDIIILTIATVFLGAFISLQSSIIKPGNSKDTSNEVMAVEIEKIAKTNTELKNQLAEATKKNQSYKDSLGNQTELSLEIAKEMNELSVINAATEIKSQGIEMVISQKLSEAQLVDLLNAIRNIGADAISINAVRQSLYTPLNVDNYYAPYTIFVAGNGTFLEATLKRKGGIIEQLKLKDSDVTLTKKTDVTLPPSNLFEFKYAEIVN